MSKKSDGQGFSFCNADHGGYIDCFFAGDSRGSFNKIFEKNIFSDNGINFFVNEVFVTSSSQNVIRGIHFQINKPQAKIVSVITGKVFDVIVDLRPDSPTFKQWWGFDMSEDDPKAVYVPRGFGHGFLAHEDNTQMLYICSGKYDRDTDTGIIYNDPELKIEWPVDDLSKTIHSERDLSLMSFREYLNNPMHVK